MKFEVSERIRTNRNQDELLVVLEEQFLKISESGQRSESSIEIKTIEESFGSGFRSDTTVVTSKKTDDGWLIIADVHYKPTAFYYIFIIVGLFSTGILWIVPIIFYIVQKNTVRTAIVDCFQRVRNEFDEPSFGMANSVLPSLEEIERLGALRDKGLLTEEEFQEKKRKMLGL